MTPSLSCVHIHLIEKDGRACQNISIKFPSACPTVISSIFGKSFHFPFPYFVFLRNKSWIGMLSSY